MRKADYGSCGDVWQALKMQLGSFWPLPAIDEGRMLQDVYGAIQKTEESLGACGHIFPNGEGFSVLNTNAYAGFLYRLSHAIGMRGGEGDAMLADRIYYLNKIMNGVEWYWNIALPEHFLCEHPVGSVLGKAAYGDYLYVAQRVTVGANFVKGECVYPSLGDFVTLYANAAVIGSCQIGSHVILAANAFVINEAIPDNCMVFGSSPNLTVRGYTQEEIRDKLVRIWKA